VTGAIIEGQPYVYTSTDLSKIRSYKSLLDQSVAVLYDREDPKKFVIASEKIANYSILFIFLLGGVFFVGLGISNLLGYLNSVKKYSF